MAPPPACWRHFWVLRSATANPRPPAHQPLSHVGDRSGCWTLAGGHGNAVYQTIGETLEAYAKAGLTTFDTADIYGPSEKILGSFQRAWTEAGNPPVQLLTKSVGIGLGGVASLLADQLGMWALLPAAAGGGGPGGC